MKNLLLRALTFSIYIIFIGELEMLALLVDLFLCQHLCVFSASHESSCVLALK